MKEANRLELIAIADKDKWLCINCGIGYQLDGRKQMKLTSRMDMGFCSRECRTDFGLRSSKSPEENESYGA